MRLIWPIFKKDARRLCWQVAVTLGLLAWVAHLDRWRADATPGLAEGWLDVLLPFAWIYLIGLLILQDPLVGDREFWPTLPCRRTVMLGAKALFLLAFIHLPYFLAQAAILGARGFSPSTYLPELLWKQVLLLAALTLPAVAVATLVENVMQFLFIAVLTCAAVVLMNAYAYGAYLANRMPVEASSARLALLLASSGAFAITLLQYGWRRTTVSRWLAVAAAVGAAALYVWLPREEVAAAFSPAPAGGTLSVSLSSRQGPPTEAERRNLGAPVSVVLASVPIEVSGVPSGAMVRYSQLALEIRAPGGERYQAGFPGLYNQKVSLEAYLSPYNSTPTLQVLTFGRALYGRIGDRTVTLRGKLIAEFHRRGTLSRMAVGARSAVPGVGTCSTIQTEIRFGQEATKVDCESPAAIPNLTHVTLLDPNTGREWQDPLGSAIFSGVYPRMTWLSPLNHRDTFFQLTTEERYQYRGSRWLVPQDVLATAQLEIVPEPVTGYAIVEYELPGITLSKYVVE
ncbi:MAG: hypothetical protein ABSF25_03980 [Bryobacteraceae bacterium]